MRRAALISASLLAWGCGFLIGIDTDLGVKVGDDAGGTIDAPSAAEEGVGPETPSGLDSSMPLLVTPPPGTNTYLANGGDSVTDFLNVTSTYGPVAYVTIAHEDGGVLPPNDCFDQTFHFRNGYIETMRICRHEPLIEELEDSGTRNQTFGSVSTRMTETCARPVVYLSVAAKPGDNWPHRCADQLAIAGLLGAPGTIAFELDGTYIYDGDETLTVMGRNVTAKHFHDFRNASSQPGGTTTSGTSTVEWHFSVEDGTLLRFKRQTDIRFNWGSGAIRYQESVDMTLAATDPADAGND